MKSNANCKIESFLHFPDYFECCKRPYLFKQTVVTWGIFSCGLVHLMVNWRTKDLSSNTSSTLCSTVTPCHCAFASSVFRSSDSWVSPEQDKKGKMEKYVKLRPCVYCKGFYTFSGMFSINDIFLLLLRTEMIQRIMSKQRILGESRGFGMFLIAIWKCCRWTHLNSSICLFKSENYTAVDIIIGWNGIIFCFQFPKPVNFTGLARAICHSVMPHQAFFSIWILYLYFDC